VILDLLEEFIRKIILAESIHQAIKVQVTTMKVPMKNLVKILILQIM